MAKLGLDAAQVGEMGYMRVEESLLRPASVTAALSPADQSARKAVMVHYAWPRRAGESGPVMPQLTRWQARTPLVDLKTATLLVNQLLPDAFVEKDQEAARPVVVLSSRGEVIRAGWVNYKAGVNVHSSIGDELVPGFVGGAYLSEILTNDRGETAIVSFHWERPPGS